jgi:hypothetical protein
MAQARPVKTEETPTGASSMRRAGALEHDADDIML